jgi:hypothetical protein
VNWAFRDLSPSIGPGRNSLKSQRSPFAVYLHLSPQADGFDGKSDGKIFLGVLFRNFTVKLKRGTRETLQIRELLPLWIAELGKSLSFPSAANPEASERSKSLSPSFMAESIPQSAYRYTGGFRGKYIGNSYNREPMPVFHLLINALRASHYAFVSPIGRILEALGEWRVWSEQSGCSRPEAVIYPRPLRFP